MIRIPPRVGVEETPELVTRVDIFLDNDRIRNVLRCDQREGWAEVLCTDDHGKLVVDQRSGEILRKRIRGDVRVVARERPL